MRYFKHHLGDYAAATQHLSILEDGIYHRLLRVYYQTEKPLLSDLKALARLIGARSKDEVEAFQIVINEYFRLEGDGWHQARCDREIEAQRDKSAKAAEAGKRGGRPRAEPKSLKEKETEKAKASPPESERTPEKKLPTTHNPLPISKGSEANASALKQLALGDDLELPAHLARRPSQVNGTLETMDLADLIWKPGLQWLVTASKRPEPACRGLMGKWRKALGSDEALLAVLTAAQGARPIEPVGWITKAIEARQQPASTGFNL